MTKKTRLADLPDFGAAKYLTAMPDESDPALLAAALGDMARHSCHTK